jgi:hypothetical protein
MAWKLSNLPGGEDFEAASADYPVEQATAAPGEKRDLGFDIDKARERIARLGVVLDAMQAAWDEFQAADDGE